MPELIEPIMALADSYRSAMVDFAAEGRGAGDDDSALGRALREYGPRWHAAAGMAQYLAALRSEGDPSVDPLAGWVHSTAYWWVEDDTFLGSLRIRHTLTPGLLQTGGHIGYDIAPAHRLRGHGTAMLRAALPRAAALGVNRALITCDTGNVGSRKIIEHSGGRFEDERAGKLRYWVPTG